MLRFDEATYLSLLFKFYLSERLSNSLWGSDVLLFSEFINIVFILFYNFIEFIIFLHTFLVISQAQYKEYLICIISFGKFPDILNDFTCARAIDNLWIICSMDNILSCLRSETLVTRGKSERRKLTYADVHFLVLPLLEIFNL